MGREVELISDEDGFLLLGDQADLDSLVSADGLPTRAFDMTRLTEVVHAVSSAQESALDLADKCGVWIKRTEESVDAMKRMGLLSPKAGGVARNVLKRLDDAGGWVEIAKASSPAVANPANLTGPAALMAQFAIQQMVDELKEYLEAIDKKLDAVLRSQTNAVLARLDGVDLVVKEAMTVRETVGRVSDVTWSKVQNTSSTILETQAYALRQLADVADQIETAAKIEELADIVDTGEAEARKWFRVLALCVQLYDSVSVIELDRVMDTAPGDLEQHLIGLRAAREQRFNLFARASARLSERMDAAVQRANSKVFLHPFRSPEVVNSANRTSIVVHDFHEVLALESERQSVEARRWIDAASEHWETVREGSSEGLDAVRAFSSDAKRQAVAAKARLAGKLAERSKRGTGSGDTTST